MNSYNRLAITKLDDFLFGRSPNPVVLKNGLVIGGGQVYPELNFTLPGMEINAESLGEVNAQYSEMIEGACTRAVELNAPGLVVEFELLPELTTQPEWGAEVVKILREKLDETAAKHAIKVALRVTPNDIREFERPPIMRSGGFVDAMFRSFELSAQAGADFLSIESTGGKEIHDEALLNGDLPAAVFALGVLGGERHGLPVGPHRGHQRAVRLAARRAIRHAVLATQPWYWRNSTTSRACGRRWCA